MFAFFKDTTEGWIFGPQPPADPPIPPEFYEYVNYVAWDLTLKGADISAIDAQQTLRNAGFERWIKRIKEALASVGVDMKYNLYRGGGSWYLTSTFAEVRIGNLQVFLQGGLYDIWTPGFAAEQLRRDARRVT